MSYDHIYVNENRIHSHESTAKAKVKRLYNQGNYVVLEAGANLLRDELFLFNTPADAQEFYDRGYRRWESFIGNGREGCGFQEISLYRDGHKVETKSCPPSTRNREHEDDEALRGERGWLPLEIM